MLAGLALHLRESGERLFDFAEHGFERVLLDAGIAAERRERLALALQFLHQIGLQIRAARDFGDFEQRGQCDVMFSRVFLSQKEREALEQVFEAQQRSDSLVEGILVKDQARSPRRWSVDSWQKVQDILMPQHYPSKSHALIGLSERIFSRRSRQFQCVTCELVRYAAFARVAGQCTDSARAVHRPRAAANRAWRRRR